MSVGLSREEGIERVYGGGGHVVILGAGASIAATRRNQERSGKQLPSMDNLIQVVGLGDIVADLPTGLQDTNFEALYSKLHADNPQSEAIIEINRRVHAYFADMQLPDEPTIYDYLVMSLRPKDLIVTFNWDPFLYQAFCRNNKVAPMPHIGFLHGNVAIGYCAANNTSGPAGMHLKADGSFFEPTQLLYPVGQKNYNSDPYIKGEWEWAEAWLSSKDTKRITVFGYGAPISDVEAVGLLNRAWGTPDKRAMEQVDIIDVVPDNVLRQRWNGFIHSHHYNTANSFFDSVLGLYPRRTSESYFHHYQALTPDEAFQSPNPVPQNFQTLEEMWTWFKPLVDAEQRAEAKKDEPRQAVGTAQIQKKPKRKPKPKKTHRK